MTPTYPEAGVIATRPATAPDATPTALIRPVWNWDSSPHVSAAAAAAVLVTRKAFTSTPFAASPDPALNPNHPNHSNAAPSTT